MLYLWKKSALIWGITILKSGYCMMTYLTQTFAEFSTIWCHIFSIDHKLCTFDTVLWKMTQSERLKVTKITPAEITKRLYHTGPRNRSYWLLHRGTIPVQIGTGYSTNIILHRPRSIQWSTFNCGVHSNVALKLFPHKIFHLQVFNLRHLS